MTPRERAERAQQLLDDPLFNEAFARVRANLVEKMENAPFDDVTAHHELVLHLKALRMVRVNIEQQLHDFKVIEAQKKQQDWVAKARQTIGI